MFFIFSLFLVQLLTQTEILIVDLTLVKENHPFFKTFYDKSWQKTENLILLWLMVKRNSAEHWQMPEAKRKDETDDRNGDLEDQLPHKPPHNPYSTLVEADSAFVFGFRVERKTTLLTVDHMKWMENFAGRCFVRGR